MNALVLGLSQGEEGIAVLQLGQPVAGNLRFD